MIEVFRPIEDVEENKRLDIKVFICYNVSIMKKEYTHNIQYQKVLEIIRDDTRVREALAEDIANIFQESCEKYLDKNCNTNSGYLYMVSDFDIYSMITSAKDKLNKILNN